MYTFIMNFVPESGPEHPHPSLSSSISLFHPPCKKRATVASKNPRNSSPNYLTARPAFKESIGAARKSDAFQTISLAPKNRRSRFRNGQRRLFPSFSIAVVFSPASIFSVVRSLSRLWIIINSEKRGDVCARAARSPPRTTRSPWRRAADFVNN